MSDKDHRARLFTGFACNNACRFCDQAEARQRTSATPDLIELVAQASAEGVTRLTFCGGEAALQMDAVTAAVRAARSRDIKDVSLFSNGRILAYSHVTKSFVEAGVNHFDVSLHGASSQSHEWATQVPGSYKQTITGIRNSRKQGAVVHIHTVVLRSNYRELVRIVEIARRLGVEALHIRFPAPEGAVLVGDRLPSLLPRYQVVRRYLDNAWDAATRMGLRMVVHGFPLCVIGRQSRGGTAAQTRWLGLPDKAWERAEPTFPEECDKCTKRSACPGPSGDYLAYYGESEFVAFS